MDNFYKKYIDPQFIKIDDISNFEKDLIEQNFKNLFDKIDEQNQKQLLYNYLLKLSIQISCTLEEDIQSSLQNINDSLFKIKDEKEIIFQVFYTLLAIFLKETWTGPSFLYTNSIKKLKQEKQSKKQIIKKKLYPNYNFQILKENFDLQIDPLINIFNYKFIKTQYYINCFNKKIIDFLEVDSENWPRLMPLTHLFIIIKEIINFLVKQNPQNPFYILYQARIKFIHSQILYTPTGTLYQHVIDNYRIFFQLLKEKKIQFTRSVLSNLYIEQSHAYLFFYKYNSSKRSLEFAQELLNIELFITGKMGKRTKFQAYNVSQLIFEVKKNNQCQSDKLKQMNLTDDDLLQIQEEQKDQVDLKQLLQSMQDQNMPKNMLLDEECILYEKPMIDETFENTNTLVQKDEKSELNINDQIYILGLIKHINTSTTHDETYYEYIQAYCDILLDKSLNWMVFSCSLLQRSTNEYVRFKKMERALLQMQSLVDQFNDKTPLNFERQNIYFHLIIPIISTYKKTLLKNT
ncbi:hypothetical protein IMG5_114170 [Ichthyophthirius multifiliis]|uniref:Uncharacterized protein n=1 Tax=Ichthyophthirius multifiliis TaxID=5932 RepID=G0QU21_ICHMU|nr:hypothetical protein IMG5_114170 [Ichthyophthirius multifiliis]EGR31288.1 hypothetical protein IMG5_114170 [Ichthyophthirius multifiliis]|eukprot:XP_004034774.1 hypothetical protein IMG5_114170 [Ichthyophthirius multifiliis]